MLVYAFEQLNQDRKNLKVNINKTEGLQLARQEKNEIETENANATYQKTFDAQLDLIIKQIETKRKHGDPEEKKVEDIFPDSNFRSTAEQAITTYVQSTNLKVIQAQEDLNLEQITHTDDNEIQNLMNQMASRLLDSIKAHNQGLKKLGGTDKEQNGAEKIN